MENTEKMELDKVEVDGKLQNYAMKISSIVIKTNDDYVEISEIRKGIKEFIKFISDKLHKNIKSADDLHKSLVKDRNELIDPFKKLDETAEIKLLAWTDEQKKIQKAAQRKLDEEARKEREKKEEAARLQRQKEEAARREQEELERKANEAKNEKERKRLQEEANKKRIEAEKAGAKADEKEVAAASVVSAVAQTNIPKVAGQSNRDNWKFECINPIDFVKWASTSGNLHLLTFNQTTCNAHAKAIRKETTVPGGRFYNEQGITNRKQ